jgi:osmotically-inducible protein OsmY
MSRKYAAVLAAAGLVVTVACAQTDGGITANVESKLAADETLKAHDVDVDSRNGVVTMTGTVETAEAKDTALRLARETEGVRDVIDQIRVGEAAATAGSAADNDVDVDVDDDVERRADDATAELGRDTREAAGSVRDAGRDAANRAGDAAGRVGAIVGDAAITSAVKAKFLADTAVQGLNIDVDTKDGIVTLNGNVASRAEADRAGNLARNTEGVKSVVNNTRVGQ